MPDGIEIIVPKKTGYEVLHSFEHWKVAFITYSKMFDKSKSRTPERHRNTDEIFVLLRGKATLYYGEGSVPLKMKKNVIYNVLKNAWHSISVSKNAVVLIVENEETGKNTTDYYLDSGK